MLTISDLIQLKRDFMLLDSKMQHRIDAVTYARENLPKEFHDHFREAFHNFNNIYEHLNKMIKILSEK
jgi:hypothetical protein